MEKSILKTSDPDWKVLYKFGGVAALAMVGIIVLQMISFMTAPPPLEGTAIDWFKLFQNNKLFGLVGFELLMIIYMILSVPLTLALYHALKRTDGAFTTLYVVLSILAVAFFISARPAFEMLLLSNQFTAATTEAQKAVLLAAGEATVAAFHGTSFHVSYVLGSLSGLIISFVMLKSNIFSKATAYVRIASSIFDFGLYIPTIGIFISIFSVLFLLIWDFMVARRLFQLAQFKGIDFDVKSQKEIASARG
jgi:hypothetical protein